MNKSRGGRLISEVRGTSLDVERVTASPEPPTKPLKRITTRLRMERVPVQPFVPSSLYEYVDRTRVRRRARWTLAAAGLLLVVIALYAYRRGSEVRGGVTQNRDAPGAPPVGEAPPPTADVAGPRPSSPASTPMAPQNQPPVFPATTTTSPVNVRALPPTQRSAPGGRSSVETKPATKTASPAPKPATDSVSHPPKVSSDAPAPSSSNAWWY